jgi:pimeloyl-ACP methyl ester carboxylesterase
MTLRPPRFEGTVVLEDDRHLGYAEYGPSTGRPMLWFHGTPGARRQIPPEAHEAAHARDVRLIAVERPGIGASTPHRYKSLLEWAADIEWLCNALDVSNFAVVGLSGGGPYALACAHEMAGRVVAAAVLGGVAPSTGPEAAAGGTSALTRFFSPIFAYTHKPLDPIMRRLIRLLEPLADQAVDLFASMMPPGDQRVFADPAVRQMFQEDLIRGSRRYMQAAFLDAILFGREWGFSLEAINVPIHLWYGDADIIVPIEHGEHMAEKIPQATLRVRAEEGHLGGLGASSEIFEVLLGHWPEAEAEAVRTPVAANSTADTR